MGSQISMGNQTKRNPQRGIANGGFHKVWAIIMQTIRSYMLIIVILSAKAVAYTSPHIEALTIPACDADASVQIIDSVADWSEINNPAKTTFCVAPGDYSAAGTIDLTISGTVGTRRYIILDDGTTPDFDDLSTNPANADVGDRAIIHGLKFVEDVDYWVVHRITQYDADSNATIVYGDYNIFNNMLLEYAPRWQIMFNSGSDYNTVQYSVCRDQSSYIDTLCLGVSDNLGDWPLNEVHNYGNKFISNEIYNYNDGIQLVHSPSALGDGIPEYQDFSGTIIDDNDIYITDIRYVNSDGDLDPNGEYACAENGIDLKVGGTGPTLAERITVSNNRIRGFRWSAGQVSSLCTTLSDRGWAIGVPTTGLGYHIQMLGNILWDNANGMTTGSGDLVEGFVRANNIITDGKNPAAESDSLALGASHGSPASSVEQIYNNAITGHGWWAVGNYNKHHSCNFIRDSLYATQSDRGTGDSNMYFTSDYVSNRINGGDAADVVDVVAAANFKDACFTIKNITDPQQICLPAVMPSATTETAPGCSMTVPLLETVQIMLAGPAVTTNLQATSFTSTITTDTDTGTWYIAVRDAEWRTRALGYTAWEEIEDLEIVLAAQTGVGGIVYANNGTVSSTTLSDSVTGLSATTMYYVGWAQTEETP